MKKFNRNKPDKINEMFDNSFDAPNEEENYFDTFSKSDVQYKKFISDLHLNPLLIEATNKLGISFPGFVENCTGEELITSDTADWFVACSSAWVDALYKTVSDYADMIIKSPYKVRAWTNMPDDDTFYFMDQIGRDSAIWTKFRERFIPESLCNNFLNKIFIPALKDNGLEYKDVLFAFVVYTLLRGTIDKDGSSIKNDPYNPYSKQRLTCKDIIECSNYAVQDYDNRPVKLNMQFLAADCIKKAYDENNKNWLETVQQSKLKQPNWLSKYLKGDILSNPAWFKFDINNYAANQMEIWDQFYRFCEDKGIWKSIFDSILNHGVGNGYDLNDTITACSIAATYMDDPEDPEEYKDLIDNYDGMNNKWNDIKCNVTRLDYSGWLQSLLLWFFGDFFYSSFTNNQWTWIYEWIKKYWETILPTEVTTVLKQSDITYENKNKQDR